jgi:hypothetical protein
MKKSFLPYSFHQIIFSRASLCFMNGCDNVDLSVFEWK